MYHTDNVFAAKQEEDKQTLAKAVSLQPLQISNWFVNQRKRHWLKVGLIVGNGHTCCAR